MNTAEREEEIRRIEHELHILQRRYASLDRSGRRMRATVYIAITMLGILVLTSAVLRHLPAFLLFGAIALALPLVCLLARSQWKSRWIDAAGWSPPGYFGISIFQTEAMAVEDMVAERMERLALLKGNYK